VLAVLVKSWPLASTMWDGDVLAGPVPTLFAEDVEASQEASLDNVAKAHSDLAKLYRAFFMPEHILVDEAADLLRKPRAGVALYSSRGASSHLLRSSPCPRLRGPEWSQRRTQVC